MRFTLTLMTDHPSDVRELAKALGGNLYAKDRMIRWRDSVGSHGYAQHTGDYIAHFPTRKAAKEFMQCFSVSCYGNLSYEIKDRRA